MPSSAMSGSCAGGGYVSRLRAPPRRPLRVLAGGERERSRRRGAPAQFSRFADWRIW